VKLAILIPPLVSATLFLAAARADDAPAAPDTAAPAGDLQPGGATYQQLLQRYDTNHDGKLDESELAAAHEDMAQQRLENGKGVGKKARQQLLDMFDKEHKGYLTAQERAEARAYLQQHLELRKQLMLERYDKNGDGKLDASERAAMQEDFRKMREKHLSREGVAPAPAPAAATQGSAPASSPGAADNPAAQP